MLDQTYIKMLIFNKEKLVYFAMPRTASTSVQKELAPAADTVFRNPPKQKHIRPARFKNILHHYFFDDESAAYVAVMREPIDWLFSWYRYRQRPYLDGHPNSTKGISFDAFVQLWLSDSPAPCAKVGSPLQFLTDRAGNLAVTHLFDFAHLTQFSAFLSARLDRPVDLGVANAAADMGPPELGLATKRQLRGQHPALFDLYDKVRSGAERRASSSCD